MITAKLLRDWNACWPDDKINASMPKGGISPRALALSADVSLDDRLWVLCKCLGYLDEDAVRRFAIECALSVAHLAGDEDDQAQYLGIMNDMIAIEDLPLNQRDAARDAAWGAARDAAWGAAWDAAWGAARDAARGAAWDAARGAAWGAAWDAARGAAFKSYIDNALVWLGDLADGWED